MVTLPGIKKKPDHPQKLAVQVGQAEKEPAQQAAHTDPSGKFLLAAMWTKFSLFCEFFLAVFATFPAFFRLNRAFNSLPYVHKNYFKIARFNKKRILLTNQLT